MPDPIKTYSLTNKQRDLSSALHTVIEKFGGFLAMFKPAPRATNPKHEWHQDRVGGRGFEVVSYASGAATLSAEDCLKLNRSGKTIPGIHRQNEEGPSGRRRDLRCDGDRRPIGTRKCR